jgi:acylphosphatase
MVRSHVLFSGTVQGVGFRYTTQRFARDLKIDGWVKNLSDGRVEMMAEAPRERIENLLYKLDKHYGDKIQHKDIDWHDSLRGFNDFVITY